MSADNRALASTIVNGVLAFQRGPGGGVTRDEADALTRIVEELLPNGPEEPDGTMRATAIGMYAVGIPAACAVVLADFLLEVVAGAVDDWLVEAERRWTPPWLRDR